jgi:hypothetical protein
MLVESRWPRDAHDLQRPIFFERLLQQRLQVRAGGGIADIDAGIALAIDVGLRAVDGDVVIETAVEPAVGIVGRLARITVVLLRIQEAVEVGILAVEQVLRDSFDQENLIDGLEGTVLAVVRGGLQEIVLVLGPSAVTSLSVSRQSMIEAANSAVMPGSFNSISCDAVFRSILPASSVRP